MAQPLFHKTVWAGSMGIVFEASKSEAMEATNKRDAPCSTSVFKSEGGGGTFLCNADVIFAKGIQLKINIFLFSLFLQQNTTCARRESFSQIIRIHMELETIMA